MKLATISLLTILFICTKVHGGVLQAKPSEARDVISLDGLWYFTTNASRVATIDEVGIPYSTLITSITKILRLVDMKK